MNARVKSEGWAPKPGSVAHRVLEFLARNPDEELYVSDIAQKFDVERTSVQAGLVAARKERLQTGRYVLDGPGLQAVSELLSLHDTQLEHHTARQFKLAIEEAARRVRAGDVLEVAL